MRKVFEFDCCRIVINIPNMALSPAARTEDISSLVKILNTETQAYSDSLSRCGVDPPSLKCPQMAPSEGKATAGPEIEKSKQAIVHACEKIVALIRGPAMWLSLEMGGMATTTSISLAIELQLHKLMSSDPDRPTHLSVLAKETGASPKLLSQWSLGHSNVKFLVFQKFLQRN